MDDVEDHAYEPFPVSDTAMVAITRRWLAASAVANSASSGGGQGPQGPKLKDKAPFVWADHVRRFTDATFKLRYRLRADYFYDLLDGEEGRPGIRDRLTPKDARKALNAKGGELIIPEVRLAAALRYFAGGAVEDIHIIYHMSKSEVMHSVWMVVDAVYAVFKLGFPFEDQAKLALLEAEFRSISRDQVWEGQVGAVDGVHFPMFRPSRKEVPDPARYHVSRKNCYALLCIAVCDASRRFLDMDISQFPTTHDSMALHCSKFGQGLATGKLPEQYFISGDAAFHGMPSMLCPDGHAEFDDFDYVQSSQRMPIECAFGILIRRWGILWRPLQVAFASRAPLIAALMKLHNYCIDKREAETTLFKEEGGIKVGKVQPGRWEPSPLFDKKGRPVEYLDTRGLPRPKPAGQEAKKSKEAATTAYQQHRDRLTKALRDHGITRPVLPKGAIAKKKKTIAKKAASKKART